MFNDKPLKYRSVMESRPKSSVMPPANNLLRYYPIIHLVHITDPPTPLYGNTPLLGNKKGNVLITNTPSTFYLQLYCVGYSGPFR